ncbi:MAG TPA: hypothetical protein VGM69_09150 [Chloroflexota bacterium]|jgi:hypothetical protein
MRKLLAVTLAGLLGLTSVVSAMAQEATSEAVLGEQARQEYEAVPTEVKLDLMAALVARDKLNTGMGQLEGGSGEAVLGEQVSTEKVNDDAMIEMLQQLKARSSMNEAMRSTQAS